MFVFSVATYGITSRKTLRTWKHLELSNLHGQLSLVTYLSDGVQAQFRTLSGCERDRGRQNVGPRPGNPSAPATHFSSRMRASNTASSAKHRQLAEIEINPAHAHTTQRREKHTSIKCKASRWVSYLNRNLVLLLEKHLKFFYKT